MRVVMSRRVWLTCRPLRAKDLPRPPAPLTLRLMRRERRQSQVCPQVQLRDFPYSHLLCALRTKASVCRVGRQRRAL